MATRRQAEARPAPLPRVPRGFRIQFFQEVWSELQKVVWPSKEEATRLTVMVIVVSVAVGITLGLIDIGFSALVRAVFVG